MASVLFSVETVARPLAFVPTRHIVTPLCHGIITHLERCEIIAPQGGSNMTTFAAPWQRVNLEMGVATSLDLAPSSVPDASRNSPRDEGEQKIALAHGASTTYLKYFIAPNWCLMPPSILHLRLDYKKIRLRLTLPVGSTEVRYVSPTK